MLQFNSLSRTIGGDITRNYQILPDITKLLAEIGNRLLSFLSKSVTLSERDLKDLQYSNGYIVYNFYKDLKFCVNHKAVCRNMFIFQNYFRQYTTFNKLTRT